jgi:ribonucleotide reductase alpha subunit
VIDFLICWAFVSGLSAGIYGWRSTKKRWLERDEEAARIETDRRRWSRLTTLTAEPHAEKLFRIAEQQRNAFITTAVRRSMVFWKDKSE